MSRLNINNLVLIPICGIIGMIFSGLIGGYNTGDYIFFIVGGFTSGCIIGFIVFLAGGINFSMVKP